MTLNKITDDKVIKIDNRDKSDKKSDKIVEKILKSVIIKECAERVNEQLKGLNLPEKYFQTALAAELREHFKHVQEEYNLQCYYRTSKGCDIQLGKTCRADLLINNEIIIEIKREYNYIQNTKESEQQCAKYLRFLKKSVCYLIVFGDSGVYIDKIINKSLLDIIR